MNNLSEISLWKQSNFINDSNSNLSSKNIEEKLDFKDPDENDSIDDFNIQFT